MPVITTVRPNAAKITRHSAHALSGSIREYLALAMITVVAAGLRFYELGRWSFWSDEYATVARSLALSEGLPLGSLSRLATRWAMTLWGVSEWSARLPAAVFGLLTVPLLYFLVRRMFDPVVALIASGLLAIAPWHIYWSQNARFYTPLLFFYTLGLFFFYFWLEEDRPSFLALSGVFFVLALNERLIALIFLLIAGVYPLLVNALRFERPRGLRWDRLALYFVLTVAGGLLLLRLEPSVVNPERMAATFSWVNNSPHWILAGVIFYLGIPLTCAAVTGGYVLLRQKPRAALLLGLAAVVPLAGVMVLSLFQYAANRYAFIALTSIVVLAAVGIRELWRQVPRGQGLVTAGFLSILLLAPMADNVLYYQYQNGNRENWKEAFALVARHKASEDQVASMERELADYYLGEPTKAMQAIGNFDEFVRARPRTWFVVDGSTPSKLPKLYRWILAHAELVASFDVSVSARRFPMRVYLYDPERPPIATEG